MWLRFIRAVLVHTLAGTRWAARPHHGMCMIASPVKISTRHSRAKLVSVDLHMPIVLMSYQSMPGHNNHWVESSPGVHGMQAMTKHTQAILRTRISSNVPDPCACGVGPVPTEDQSPTTPRKTQARNDNVTPHVIPDSGVPKAQEGPTWHGWRPIPGTP